MKNNGFLKRAMSSKAGRGIAMAAGLAGVAATTNGCSVSTCVGDSYECGDTEVIVDARPIEIICDLVDVYGQPYTEVNKVRGADYCDIVRGDYGREVACFNAYDEQITTPGDFPYSACDYYEPGEPGYRNLNVGAAPSGVKIQTVGKAAAGPKVQ